MLSGYILARRYCNDLELKSYFISRFAKIYPIYVVAAVITIPWIGIDFNGDALNFFKSFIQLSSLVLANILLIQAWFPPMFNHWNNGGSWSISVEFFLYFIFPFLVPLLNKLNNKNVIFLIACLFVGTVLPGLVMITFTPAFFAFYSIPLFRLCEFVLGILAFQIMRDRKLTSWRWEAGLFLATAVVCCYLGVLGNKLPNYISHNWIVIPFIFLTLLVLGNSTGLICRFLSLRIFTWFGHISYCFYSFQVLIILFLIDNGKEIASAYPSLQNNWILCCCSFIILTLISWLSFSFIEEPLRKKIRQRLGVKKPDLITKA